MIQSEGDLKNTTWWQRGITASAEIKTETKTANMATSFQVARPESFNFACPKQWMKWIRRFECFRIASGLSAKDKVQVNTLIYTMGDEADDILRSFNLSEDDYKRYDAVKSKFESHFDKRRNVINERARFNMRRQEENEAINTFVTVIYTLAEHCGYGSQHDEIIRDRIIMEIRNTSLSERLHLDPKLMLEVPESVADYIRHLERHF